MLKAFDLSDDQKEALMGAYNHGTISTIKGYGYNKSTVRSLLDRGILEYAGYAVQPRYTLSYYGFELAEWLIKTGRVNDAQRPIGHKRNQTV